MPLSISGDHPVEAATGLAVDTFWEKMSKSKRNGVDPEVGTEERERWGEKHNERDEK